VTNLGLFSLEMGASSSKIEEDKALLICCERKEFVREALDRRCLLGAAHLEYMQSLRNTGTSLRKFVQPEVPSESSFQEGKSLRHRLDNADDIRRRREEEGFPELEEEGEKASTTEGDNNCTELDTKLDKACTEHVVQMRRNRNEVLNHPSYDVPLVVPSVGSVGEITQQNGEKKMLGNGLYEIDETSEVRPSKTTSSVMTLSMTGKDEESVSENKRLANDFFSCVKEIDDLFLKTSESGREVLRMLETDKVLFSPLFREEIGLP